MNNIHVQTFREGSAGGLSFFPKESDLNFSFHGKSYFLDVSCDVVWFLDKGQWKMFKVKSLDVKRKTLSPIWRVLLLVSLKWD